MNCRDVIEFLDDYFAGRLSPPVRESFEEHIGRCPYCRDYIATYRDAVRMGKAGLARPEDAREMPEELVRAILASRGKDKEGA